MPNIIAIRRLIVGMIRGGNVTPSSEVLITENGINLETENGLNLFITE